MAEATAATTPPVHYIRSRIANACDACKARKVKCDGHQPCTPCARRQRPHACHYSPPRRRRRRPDAPASSSRGSRTRPATPAEPTALRGSSNNANNGDGDDGNDAHVDDEEEAEVPREARLLCDAHGKLIFVGDCAPLSFFQSVRQLVTAKVGPNALAPESTRYSVLENAPAHAAPSHRRAAAAAAFMPPVDPAEVPAAVAAYLSTTTALVDLFDAAQLHRDLAAWAARPSAAADDPAAVVHLLVLAIGRQVSDAAGAQAYFEHARDAAVARLGADLGIATVQAFTLVTVYMLCSCQINGAFLFFGIAVRAAYSVGLHRADVNARFGRPGQRQRDRLWKSLRVVDLFLSTSMGRPPATSDVDCTVEYHAAPDDDDDVNDAGQCDLLSASVQIFLILEGIVVEIYSRRKISLQLTEGISVQLREWSVRWLRQLKAMMTSRTQTEAHVSGACQVLSTYYYAVMLVSRPFLMYEICRRLSDAPSTPTAMASGKSKLADACIDAASLMVDPIQELVARGVLAGRVPFLVSWIFASSLVLGVGLLGGFGRILEKSTRLSIHALDHFAQHDTHAAQYSLIAQSLLTTALEHLEKRELQDRRRRTESSSQLFGLMPSDAAPSSSSPARPSDEAAAAAFVGPQFGELDSAFLGMTESLWQTPDASYWHGSFGSEGDAASALNLFPLLDAGGGIDLAHHF